MAADILLYKATHVPVGHDQKQHLELARDLAFRFNHQTKTDFFPAPDPLILGPMPRVMSLRDGTVKMSKSDPSVYSRIDLTDTPDEIRLKIQKAKTDGGLMPETIEEMNQRPEVLNLLTLYSAVTDTDLSTAVSLFSSKTFSPFKEALTEALIETLSPIRSTIFRLLEDRKHLEDILKYGTDRAQEVAHPNLLMVKRLLGLPVFD